jgi:hypothetical protein
VQQRVTTPFTALERDIFEWVATHCEVPVVAQQLRRAVLIRRDYTGVGFHTYCCAPDELPAFPLDTPRPLEGPQIESPELEYGAGSLVWHEDGRLSCLEIFAYGDSFPESLAEYGLVASPAAAPQGDPAVDSNRPPSDKSYQNGAPPVIPSARRAITGNLAVGCRSDDRQNARTVSDRRPTRSWPPPVVR